MHSRVFRNIVISYKKYFRLYNKTSNRNFCYSNTVLKNLGEDYPSSGFGIKNSSVKKLLDEATISYDAEDRSQDDSTEKNLKNEKKHSLEPSDTCVVVFPGQGTQFVGMGKRLLKYPYVKEMYERASEILEYDLLKLSCEGPASDLAQTKFQQPAIFVASLAAVEKLRCEQPSLLESCEATAGFSIGEIAALTFAGSFTFENALRLVKIRGEAMQIASDLNRSGMITVFFGHDTKLKFACTVAKEYCQKIGLEDVDCRVASYLYPECKVVAGNIEALEFIQKNKDDFNLRKIKRIDVSGAFHTDLMKPAAFAFSEALKSTPVADPEIPVISNVNGLPYTRVSEIRKQLPKQIYSPVKWEQILHYIYAKPSSASRYPRTFECGPGKSLSSILKMVNAKAAMFSVSIEV